MSRQEETLDEDDAIIELVENIRGNPARVKRLVEAVSEVIIECTMSPSEALDVSLSVKKLVERITQEITRREAIIRKGCYS